MDNAFYILGDCGSADGDFPNSTSGIVNDRLFKFSNAGVFSYRRDFYVSRPFGVACSFVKLPNESGNFISGLLSSQTGTDLFTVDYIGSTIASFFCKLNGSDGSTAWAKQPFISFQASSASISILDKSSDGNILCSTYSQGVRQGNSRIFTINSLGAEIKTILNYPCPPNYNQNNPSTYCFPPTYSGISGNNGVVFTKTNSYISKICPIAYAGIPKTTKLYCNSSTISDTLKVPDDNNFNYQWKRNGTVCIFR